MKLDFTEIQDDQFVELISAALAEAASRTQAVRMATKRCFLDEAEKAQIAQDAIAHEAENIRRAEAEKARAGKTESAWEKKNALIARVHELFGTESFVLTVWNKTDKRIYLRRSKAKFGNNCVEFFCEGNTKTRPGTLQMSNAFDEKRKEITAFLKEICTAWNSLTMECD